MAAKSLFKSLFWLLALLLLSGLAYTWLGYGLVRGDFGGGKNDLGGMLGAITLLGAAYLLIFRFFDPKRTPAKTAFILAIGAAILFRLIFIGTAPNLSDDFFRFIWDGRLWHLGLDPLAFTPNEWYAAQTPDLQAAFNDLFPHLNSKDYYTVYPPLLQWVFRLATWIFPKGILGPVAVMKLVIIVVECGSLWFISRILNHWKLDARLIFLYALNPMVIVELTGNLHFEAFMVLGLLAAIWFFATGKWVWGAAGFALAIGAKLIPILFFPFLLKRLGWQKWLLSGVVTAILCTLLFIPWLSPKALEHVGESLKLYYQYFSYNASVFYFLSWVSGGVWVYVLGKILPWLTVALLLLFAYKEKDRTWRGLPAMLLLGYGTYELFATTIHPWYLAPLVAFAALTQYRWAILWSLLIPFTYIAYWFEYYQSPWILWAEYLLVLGFALYEWIFVRKQRTLEEWAHESPTLRSMIARSIPKRVAIKLERIHAMLPQEAKILDMGTGNGGLVRELRLKGHDITTVDVKNISFFEEVQPIIYDGITLPFPDQSFDTVTIITVLHHTPDPDILLREALRVSRNSIVIMEDIYRNPIQQYLTYFMDSIVNLEFAGHPHTNRNRTEWLATFEALGLKVTHEEQFRTLGLFRQVIWKVTH